MRLSEPVRRLAATETSSSKVTNPHSIGTQAAGASYAIAMRAWGE